MSCRIFKSGGDRVGDEKDSESELDILDTSMFDGPIIPTASDNPIDLVDIPSISDAIITSVSHDQEMHTDTCDPIPVSVSDVLPTVGSDVSNVHIPSVSISHKYTVIEPRMSIELPQTSRIALSPIIYLFNPLTTVTSYDGN